LLQFGPIEYLAVAANLAVITQLHRQPEKLHRILSQQELSTAPSDSYDAEALGWEQYQFANLIEAEFVSTFVSNLLSIVAASHAQRALQVA
jgi:hypothetical protein